MLIAAKNLLRNSLDNVLIKTKRNLIFARAGILVLSLFKITLVMTYKSTLLYMRNWLKKECNHSSMKYRSRSVKCKKRRLKRRRKRDWNKRKEIKKSSRKNKLNSL